jgi:hypothetical protein
MLLHSLWVQPGMLFARRSLISERVRKKATMEARKHWASRSPLCPVDVFSIRRCPLPSSAQQERAWCWKRSLKTSRWRRW